MAFDPAKAALYNQLVRQGLSSAAAAAQAGIGDDDGNYEIDEIGTPATNPNFGTIQQGGADMARRQLPQPPKPTAEQLAEDAATDAELDPPPGSRNITSSSYTTTSTVTVSGGGSTTITAGPKVSTAGSEAVQPAINAKQAEIDAFNKDNPSPFARKKQGLPPLTTEENEARIAKQSELNDQRTALVNGQTELKASTPPTVTTVPNTTTTTQTVTTGTSSTNQAVDPFNDEKLSQENEAQLDAAASPANASTTRSAAPVSPEDDPFEAERLAAEQALNDEPVEFDPADVDPEDDPFEAARVEAEQEQNRQDLTDTATEAEPVEEDPYETARLDTEAEFNDEPVEFDPADVDPEDDPFEAERLEREQELNRQELTETATELEPVEEDPYETARLAAEDRLDGQTNAETVTAADSAAARAQSGVLLAQKQKVLAAQKKMANNGDWRVRLSLGPDADYLYAHPTNAGILAPLNKTDGVIFPYTPKISTSYKADYDAYTLTHSNFKGYFYKSSFIDAVNVTATFTAQDSNEADYLLAVIHFFRSVTKMFYGQDAERGAPPPMVYLTGLGQFQFSGHPCLVSSFDYTLPSDVDYIRARSPNINGANLLSRRAVTSAPTNSISSAVVRLAALFNSQGINKGAIPSAPSVPKLGLNDPTYVPTKIDISLTLLPVQTRSQVSKQFSLKQYANGDLLKGGFW